MLIKYVDRKFKPSALATIDTANRIIREYTADGFDLTLRQLYYQFVSRDLIANNMQEYKRLGSVINDARLAGLISWKAIEDRTRNVEGNSHWAHPRDIVRACASQFQIDKWSDQENRVEVWVEKDALIGIVERVARELDVKYFSCRGYTSQSEMWAAGQRFNDYISEGQTPVVIHLGDHDPSGVDMSRDITDRLEMFCGEPIEVNRIALNRDQVDKYNPPPNPAKITDSRAEGYIKKHGRESWELDALEPRVLSKLIKDTVLKYRNAKLYAAKVREEDEHKLKLETISEEMD